MVALLIGEIPLWSIRAILPVMANLSSQSLDDRYGYPPSPSITLAVWLQLLKTFAGAAVRASSAAPASCYLLHARRQPEFYAYLATLVNVWHIPGLLDHISFCLICLRTTLFCGDTLFEWRVWTLFSGTTEQLLPPTEPDCLTVDTTHLLCP